MPRKEWFQAEELKKYSTVVEKFDEYFANPIYERARLSKRIQEPGETAEQYILALYAGSSRKLWIRQRSTSVMPCASRISSESWPKQYSSVFTCLFSLSSVSAEA